MNRRELLKKTATGSLWLGLAGTVSGFTPVSADDHKPLKGNINHSVCRWTYPFLSLDDLCEVVNHAGFAAIDLIGPKEWPTLKKHGIHASMCNGAEINLINGWNNTAYHATLIKNYTDHIDLVSRAGYKNLICFSGNREGMDDETGLKNCEAGLKNILGVAEKNGVVVQMELFNSKINHPDYMCDNTPWGIELCRRIGSPNFKLLYDIYHMQISEGDIIRTISNHHQWFGHYHTAGVPGRHEIDGTQELHYPAIMRAISETGFGGYVAQEFIPTGHTEEEKIIALEKAVRICDV